MNDTATSTPASDLSSGPGASKKPFYSRRSHKYSLAISAFVILLSVLLPLPTGGKLVVFGIESPPLCVFQAKFGIDCPGCGLTRSFVSMGHVEFAKAWAFNRVGPLFFLVFFFQIPYRLLALRDPKLQLTDRRWDLTLPIIAALMLINWVVNFFL